MKKTKFIFKYKFLISILLILISLFLTVGYSVYFSELYITGVTAQYRKNANVRITSVTQNSIFSSASNNYLEYNVSSIISDITLPNTDSYITYNVEITNYGNVEMGILNITGLDDNLEYELTNYNLKEKVCNTNNECKLGISKTFQIKIKYKDNQYDSNNIDHHIKLDFDFRGYHSITYHDITLEFPSIIMDGDVLDITFINDIPESLVIKEDSKVLEIDTDYTYIDNRLIINNVSNNLDIYKKDITDKLIDIILMNENNSYVVDSSKKYILNKGIPNFANQATTDEGLYLTKDEDGDVYYYRGAVDDNHVLFAGFCWEIIRTTGTGGVKIIYDGLPSNGKCTNIGETSYIQKSTFNSSYDSPAYVGYMYGDVYNVISKEMNTLSGNIVYGNDVTFDKETGEYTLLDTIEKDVANWATDYSIIRTKYHYTCFTNQTTCTSVHYMNHNNDSTSYYFVLREGKKHTDILNEMLNDSTNSNDSTAKYAVDSWYKQNMLDYTSQLEDTVFCNDRTISSYGGWDKDKANSNWLYFGTYSRLISSKKPSLICPRFNDKFTVNVGNGNGDLTYPIGLITADEIAYAGGVYGQTNTAYYLYTGEWHLWSASPYDFSNSSAYGFYLSSSSNFSLSGVPNSYGLRPVISLKPGTIVSYGDGSSDNPYLVD